MAWSQLPQRQPAGAPSDIAHVTQQQEVRIGMLQALEDLVQRERFFRKRSGAFTAVLGKLEFEVPTAIRGLVDVRVTSADREHLVVEAFWESGQAVERVWMAEQFRVQANFPVQGLRWVVLQGVRDAASSSDWGAAGSLPDLEIEPVSSTASSGVEAE